MLWQRLLESIATRLTRNNCAASSFLSRLAGLRADQNFAGVKPRQCWPDTISLMSASNKNLIWILNTFLVIGHNFFFLEILYFIVRTFKVMAEFGSPSTLYCKLFFHPNSFSRTDVPQFQAKPAVLFRSLAFDNCSDLTESDFDTIILKHCCHIVQMCESKPTELMSVLPSNSKLRCYMLSL